MRNDNPDRFPTAQIQPYKYASVFPPDEMKFCLNGRLKIEKSSTEHSQAVKNILWPYGGNTE